MANGIRTGDPPPPHRRFNKRCSLKFCVGSRVWQTPVEDRRTYRPKHCGNNNKDEDNCPKTLNDKNTILQFCMLLPSSSVTNNTGQWAAKFAWYSPSAFHWICLYGLEYGFRPTWSLRFLQLEQSFFNLLVNVLGWTSLFTQHGPVQTS